MKKILLPALTLALGLVPLVSDAQKSRKNKSKAPVAQAAPPKVEKASIESKVKTCKKKEGLFTLYQDTVSGKVYILVKKEQIGKEFIYFSYSENGVSAVGANRGSYRDNKIFRINKYYENIEFEQRNTNFWFDPSNELSKSSEANIAPSILASEKIIAGDEKNGYLLDADELFLGEKLQQIKPSPFPGFGGMGFQLGMLSRSKTRFRQMSNYPENTDLVVDYAFDNPYPTNYGDNDVTDARSVTVTIQHSIIEMPKNNFVPRFDDPRVGYFSEQVDNQTSKGAVNYRDLIHRWNLEKKDKNAAISDPIKPIKWWIEKTTPLEYRETIKQAGLQWNKAFEAAGYSNAVQIEVQSDTATWDAGDIRYNVLRWTSSPNPPFGGYGPSFVNPRTGEILGADIMFEYIFVTNREARQKLFETAMNGEYVETPYAQSHRACDAQHNLHQQTMFGQQILNSQGARLEDKSEMIRQSLYYLVLHEMGHTMGLMHNMKASQLMSPTQLLSSSNDDRTDIIGSVMDYPALNLPLKAGEKVKYSQTQPGPYDMWAIALGYGNMTDSQFDSLLRLSSKPELTFGNDADDMRSAGGGGIDPRVNVNDLSGDAITYSINRIGMVKETMKSLKEKYTPNNETYQEMVTAFNILYGEHAGAGSIISRYIGGVYVDRSAAGTANTQPYTPVAYADQKRAMKALNDFIMAPDAFAYPAEIASFLQQQRRGFGFFGNPEDPKFHDRVIAAQANIFNQVLSPVVLKRLTDTRVYGNKYAVSEMVSDLTRSVFNADLQGDVNTFRQNLQTLYVNRLIMVAGLNDKLPPMGYDNIAKATAYNALVSIKSSMKTALGGNKETKDHRNYIVFLIDQALTK